MYFLHYLGLLEDVQSLGSILIQLREHLRPIFEKVTSQIRKLVNNQIKAVMEKKGRRPTVRLISNVLALKVG